MRPTIHRGHTGPFVSPGQRYQMHRARSARWEAERNRANVPFFVDRHPVIHSVFSIAAMLAAAALLLVLFVIAITPKAQADPPRLFDGETGKYLGNLSANQYDPDSVNNPYGQYGNKYSPDSINNEWGQYGSPYSPDSARNPWATNPPVIIGDGDGFGGEVDE